MTDSFYVTLPSNSSMNSHPNNTLSHYYVTLPSPLSFEGDWEVAIAEISYPHRWLNVVEGENSVVCAVGENSSHLHRHRIPEGYYPTPEDLFKSFEPPIDHDGRIRFSYNKYIQKVILKTEGAVVRLMGGLATMLGFEKENFITTTQKAPRVADLQPFHSLFIYSNIVEYNTVGDTRAPLLRIVTVDGKYGKTITKTYDNPHYVNLKHKLVDTIEIDIRDDTGRLIPFVAGKVIVKVHFRRKRSSYFG